MPFLRGFRAAGPIVWGNRGDRSFVDDCPRTALHYNFVSFLHHVSNCMTLRRRLSCASTYLHIPFLAQCKTVPHSTARMWQVMGLPLYRRGEENYVAKGMWILRRDRNSTARFSLPRRGSMERWIQSVKVLRPPSTITVSPMRTITTWTSSQDSRSEPITGHCGSRQ